MRKTRLVILPTKCLHQMGFLLLFLSCPVIGDWGRIRPESETLHKAIQVEREGTCGLQRDPPGKVDNLLEGNGSDECRLSEDTDSIRGKGILNEERGVDEERVPSQGMQERGVRGDERRDVRWGVRRRVDERRDVRRESERRAVDERRDVRREWGRDARREGSQMRSRSVEPRRLREASPARQQENERAARRERMSPARRTWSESESEMRNEGGRVQESRRESRGQDERRVELRRRSVREGGSSRREKERTVRERQDVRRENRRSGSSVRRGVRERSQERRSERLSLAGREETNERRTGERRLSQMRNDLEQRKTRRVDNRRGAEMRGLEENERDARGRRVEVFQERMVEMKSRKMAGDSREVIELGGKGKRAELSGLAKWVDFKGFDSFKGGDWTTNCVVGAVVYYLSTRRIKSI